MKKQSVLRVVNPLLALAFLAVAGAAVGRRAGLVDGDLFRLVHPNAGFAFITLAVLHLILNWGWVRTAFGGGRRS